MAEEGGTVARRQVAGAMAEAAGAWLDMLDAEQRRIAAGEVPSDEPADGERRRWFYTPTDHGGLTLHQQRPAQQRAALRLLGSRLSTTGDGPGGAALGLGDNPDSPRGFVAPLHPGARRQPRPVLP